MKTTIHKKPWGLELVIDINNQDLISHESNLMPESMTRPNTDALSILEDCVLNVLSATWAHGKYFSESDR